MKYKVILLSFIFIGLNGCANLEVSEKNNSAGEIIYKKNNFYKKYKATGVIKFKLKENQSTYIPRGEIHRLENNGHETLEIIEIQTGEYFGEDDIIRLEDDYKRS